MTRRLEPPPLLHCARCGKTSSWRPVGDLCYGCYAHIADLLPCRVDFRDPERERRIERYRDRAALQLPLFGETA